MLSQLLFVRLKAAENALRDGRLDEAYRLATAPDLREHRRGAAVLAKLTKQFVERARQHYRTDRFTEALIDLDKAETGGVMKDDVVQLREQVHTVAKEADRRAHSQRKRIVEARRRVQDGSLIAGRKILDQASRHDEDAQYLQQDIKARTQDVQEMVKQAESLIKQGQYAVAARRIAKAKSRDKHNEAVQRVETKLCELVLEKARTAIKAGHVKRATDELACLGDLGDTLPSKREVMHMLSLIREARGCIEQNRYNDARQHMMRLDRLMPKADWLAAVIDQLRQQDELDTALGAGPLGERTGGTVMNAKAGNLGQTPSPGRADHPKPSSLDDTVALPALTGVSGGLPAKLLLLVDGGGSFLILRNPQASVGRAASNNPADVPLFSDVGDRHANISRVDDDYFLFSGRDVEIGGRKTKHQLLRDGDRITFGRKAKMTFRLPSRKSATAVLDLSDTTKMPHDVRRVVLFDKTATVGTGSNAHIRCQHAGTPLVLFEREGALWIRQRNNGHVDTEPVKLAIGQSVEIAGACLALEPWPTEGAGSIRV